MLQQNRLFYEGILPSVRPCAQDFPQQGWMKEKQPAAVPRRSVPDSGGLGASQVPTVCRAETITLQRGRACEFVC